MRDYVVLYVNGQRHEVRGAAAFQMLSGYLRNNLGLTGTKVVCSEGDCGSCTVLLGRVNGGSLQYRSACSCIQFLFQADGCHVVTVEGLSNGRDLDPVQQALVEHQGSQCGFCTPGIVMSIHALLESDPVLSEERLRQGLVGNLCRCTGYDPIVRAGLQIDSARTMRMNQLFNAAEMHSELERSGAEAVRIESGGRMFFRPASIGDATCFKATHPDCVVVSGGTDLGVQVSKGAREIRNVLSTAALRELRESHASKTEVVLGANISIAELERVAADNLPDYAELLRRFGSPQIKNSATLGGNIANGSPIGDSMPALFVLNAEIELSGVNGSRFVNINNFYTGYKKTVASPDELISRIRIPRLGSDEALRLFKVSKRRDLDISSFSAAIWLRMRGQKIEDARIAYGGVAPGIVRLPGTEAYLTGKSISADSFDSAGKIAASEISPISDVRGSADYRYRLAANILRKLYHSLDADMERATTTA